VGGGPAGAVLSYMLARQGIPVALLEMHQNFERDFRGDTLHPSILEIMDELGLLLIGDAAHVMSPAGGNGIHYAVNDAVAAANILGGPLKDGHVSVGDLARVQRRRDRPTRIIQGIVNVMQEQLLRPALETDGPLTVPGFVPWPVVRHVLARVIGFGVGREHVAIATSSSAAGPSGAA
jgi:2-polyprenyl-6-methoxyphenol hydroxylase-like FAD-dependent oxidoreductase